MVKEFKTFSAIHTPKLNQVVLTFLKENSSEDNLLRAMTYSLEAGGKKIRPLLLLAVLDMLNIKPEKAHYQVAGALEMVHTYSLIHDDLPAMDNDDLRRGKPTNHKVFGEGLAILAGDGLLTESFHLVTIADLTPNIKVSLLKELASSSGTKGMIGGQVGDIEGEKKRLSLSELEYVHARKTGALLLFAVKAGLIIGKANQEVSELLESYGTHFGIAFQIKDDILDVIGDEAAMGKKIGSDQALDKSTYTSLLGVEKAQEKLAEHIQQALESLAKVKVLLDDCDTSLLENLIKQLG